MKKNITLEQAMPLMEELLSAGKEVSFVPSGTSMIPLILGGRDQITLKRFSSPPAKYDVPLYRRSDGSFVLHRIIGTCIDGYIMCGDHQTAKEYPVKPEDIIAVMVSVDRNGRHIDCNSFGYKAYSRIWSFLRPVRPVLFKIASVIPGMKKRILGTKE